MREIIVDNLVSGGNASTGFKGVIQKVAFCSLSDTWKRQKLFLSQYLLQCCGQTIQRQDQSISKYIN